jgi:methyl-accepting chemotaxis protein
MYIGYKTDDIITLFPGSKNASIYSPSRRSWYRTASLHTDVAVVLEPYIDAFTGKWVTTISKAIIDQDRTVDGIVGIDIDVSFFNDISQIKFLSHGFAVICSTSGLVLSDVKYWKFSTDQKRVFDEEVTGIS